MHALHGNTPPPDIGKKIAIWWLGDGVPDGWYTGCVTGRNGQAKHIVDVEYDCDGLTWTHDLHDFQWEYLLPQHRMTRPKCPDCNLELGNGTGYGSNIHGTKNKKKFMIHTCEECAVTFLVTSPHLLARTDPHCPRVTEAPSVRKHQRKEKPTQPLQHQQQPLPPVQTKHRYRPGVTPAPCLADTVWHHQNVNGLAAPGAARAYLRDVALRRSDVHSMNETGLTAGRAEHLAGTLAASGHRLYAATPTTRGLKGSGTAVLIRATVPRHPAEGIIHARPDGKAMAVALSIARQPIVYLPVHLPHDDGARETFLRELAAAIPVALAAQTTKTDASGTPIGAPWLHPVFLWGGDMNFTTSHLDDQQPDRPAPSPGLLDALSHLNDITGGSIDVYRAIHPHNAVYTHGKPEKGNQRRIDWLCGSRQLLAGPSGVVAASIVPREAAAFSYLNLHTRKEVHKQSDHDMLQVVLRTCKIMKPPRQPMIRPATLRHPEVHGALDTLLDQAQAALATGASSKLTVERLNQIVLDTCVEHQRAQAKAAGKRRVDVLNRIRTLQRKLGLPHLSAAARAKSAINLERYKRKLHAFDHAARRRRDAQEEYDRQMEEAGQGKAAKPIVTPAPITEAVLPDGRVLTGQADIHAAHTDTWRKILTDVHEPTLQAQRDAAHVFAQLASTTTLPEGIKRALEADRIVAVPNIIAAIRDLARNSTPGGDRIPLEFYLRHTEKIAPLLSSLYTEALRDGRMTDSMVKATLSPIYKEKGLPSDTLMYRPISVTTVAYRIFAKCIAQRLNIAVKYLLGDPQVGYCPHRTLDENVILIRQLIHDVNTNRPHDGGMILMLDNTKAFDRVQHDFMFRTLEAFGLPASLIDAVRTLYADASISIKLNGQVGPAFKATSGVKQGCPLSGLLYVLVQEVQMFMIRTNPDIAPIPIPGPDGHPPQPAARLPAACSVKERCLVDDMLVAVASEASIPPLLDTLDRFEAMSHHAMQIKKTVLILLGDSRGFDIRGPTEAARRLRARELAAAHDISGDGPRQLPEKWHGVVLGNDLALSNAWEQIAAATTAQARSLQACALPNGCQGRQKLARGQLMGKAQAALKFQAPHDDAVVDSTLATIQKAADSLVFGRRRFLDMNLARQPRSSMGTGHLDVTRHMRAIWMKPLFAAAGADPATRPYKNFYAQLIRRAYPEMDAGAELLTLNLGFHAVLDLPAGEVLGETRQAFRALAALPPFRYSPPVDDSDAQPREDMTREELLDQLLHHNPILDRRPVVSRAGPQDEVDMRLWAARGVRRVRDVLDSTATAVLTFEQLRQSFPTLCTSPLSVARARRMHGAFVKNLRPWADTIAVAPLPTLTDGEFRSAPDGQILRALRDARPRDRTVPAELYERQPSTGLLAPTGAERRLPACRARTTSCHVACLGDGPEDDDSQFDVHDAQRHTHFLRAPIGCCPRPDPRVIAWSAPRVLSSTCTTTLASATNKAVTLTYAAQEYVTPRVFQGANARYAALVAGLSPQARDRRIAAIAQGIAHAAIPQEEAHHLSITIHHGHIEGANKCAGDEALCARCLADAHPTEETAVHKYYSCQTVLDHVWGPIARAWHRTTGDTLDFSSPLLAITGLRLQPPNLTGDALKRWKDLEPAWRLLHSVALLQIHRARCATHTAYHDVPRREPPKSATPKAILAAVRRRFQQRLDHEHAKAANAVQGATRAHFQRHWITTRMATDRGRGPRSNLFAPALVTEQPEPGVCIRVAAAFLPGTAHCQPTAGWALEAHDVAADGAVTLRLRAHGAAPARSTHGALHPHVPPRHTAQAAHHTAAAAALRCLEHTPRLHQPGHTTLTLASPTTYLDLEAPADPPAAQPPPQRAARTTRGKRQRVPNAPSQPHRRRRQHAALIDNNRATLSLLRLCNNNNIRLQTYPGATPLDLYATAQRAASLADTQAHIQTTSRHLSHPLWQQSRTWDPDD